MAARSRVRLLLFQAVFSVVLSSVVDQDNGTSVTVQGNGTSETQCPTLGNARYSPEQVSEQRDCRYLFPQSDVRSLPTARGVYKIHLDISGVLTQVSESQDMLNSVKARMLQRQKKEEDWIAYMHEYFGDKDTSTNLTESYSSYPVARLLAHNEFFWPWMCRFWKDRQGALGVQSTTLPETLDLTHFVAYYLQAATSEKFQDDQSTHDTYMIFASMQRALQKLPGTDTIADANVAPAPATLKIDRLAKIDLSATEARALAELFPYMRRLNKLQLTNSMTSPEASGKVIDRLDVFVSLQELNLNGNAIGDAGIGKLLDKLSSSKDLKKLQLKRTSLTPVGGATIAEKIGELTGLNHLALSYNELAASLASMGEALARMPNSDHFFVILAPATCSNATLPTVERQVREMIHKLKAMVTTGKGEMRDLYDGAKPKSPQNRKWEAVKDLLNSDVRRTGVWINVEKVVIWVWIKVV